MKPNLRGWRSLSDFKRHSRTLGFQIQEAGSRMDPTYLRKAIAAFKKDPDGFLAKHQHLNAYVGKYAGEG